MSDRPITVTLLLKIYVKETAPRESSSRRGFSVGRAWYADELRLPVRVVGPVALEDLFFGEHRVGELLDCVLDLPPDHPVPACFSDSCWEFEHRQQFDAFCDVICSPHDSFAREPVCLLRNIGQGVLTGLRGPDGIEDMSLNTLEDGEVCGLLFRSHVFSGNERNYFLIYR